MALRGHLVHILHFLIILSCFLVLMALRGPPRENFKLHLISFCSRQDAKDSYFVRWIYWKHSNRITFINIYDFAVALIKSVSIHTGVLSNYFILKIFWEFILQLKYCTFNCVLLLNESIFLKSTKLIFIFIL